MSDENVFLKISFQKFQEEKEESEADRRLSDLRNVMRSRSSSQGHAIDAFIVSSYDEHQIYQTDDSEGRLQFISGFTGPMGDAVVTLNSASLWVESSYAEVADKEVDCHWKIFVMGDDPTIAMWLAVKIFIFKVE